MNLISKAGLVGLALVLTIAGCAKSSDNSSATTSASGDNSATSPMTAATAGAMNGASASDGAKLYQTNCSSCHQPAGTGIEGTFPPLAGNPVVLGDATKVIHIVKYGLTGKIAVKGHDYNGMMPDWGKQLSDADIASTIT
ncbi:MAG: cytochrome c, partial [Candidatus Baltobacteraceae bacterium]